MELETLRQILCHSSWINFSILLLWFFLFVVFHNQLYRCHHKFFNISVETFDTFNYAGMGIFKLTIFTFNVVPCIALSLILK